MNLLLQTAVATLESRIRHGANSATVAEIALRFPAAPCEAFGRRTEESPYHGRTFTFLSLADVEAWLTAHAGAVIALQRAAAPEVVTISVAGAVIFSNGATMPLRMQVEESGRLVWAHDGPHPFNDGSIAHDELVSFGEYLVRAVLFAAHQPSTGLRRVDHELGAERLMARFILLSVALPVTKSMSAIGIGSSSN